MAKLEFKDPEGTFKIATDEEFLADINNAIQVIFNTGQSYSIVGGRTFTFASLGILREMKTEYEDKVLAARGETGVFHGDTGGNYNDEEATS